MALIRVWILTLWLYETSPAKAMQLNHSLPLVSVESGSAVTFQCSIEGQSSVLFVWYKQRLGHLPQKVGIMGTVTEPIISTPFANSFKIERKENIMFLSIARVSKDDEGLYFCGLSQVNLITFYNGTFLVVKGDPQVNISVVQSPERGSVSPGEEVTLQCSVFSQIKAAELTVLWVRAAAGQSFPQIISTGHSSSSRPQCEIRSSSHSCVSNFTKNITHRSNRAATYYCAVEVCGRVVFGSGTVVEGAAASVNSLVLYLAVALGVCVTVISAQAAVVWKLRRCGHSDERFHQGRVTDNVPHQENSDAQLSYAALHFSKATIKREQREQLQESNASVYSEVKQPKFVTTGQLHSLSGQ